MEGLSSRKKRKKKIMTWPRCYKTFFMLISCSGQLRLKFMLLINVKMPTIVGILTFMSRIDYRIWHSKPLIFKIFGLFSVFMSSLKFILS